MTTNLVQVQGIEAGRTEQKNRKTEPGPRHLDKLWVLDLVPLTHLSSSRCPGA